MKTAAAPRSANYQTVNLFLDNDQSGVDVAFQFQRDLPGVVNQAELFHPHKDLNAFLVTSTKTTTTYEAIEAACRAVFQAHPHAKAEAYQATTRHPASSYQPRRSIADNIANEQFRSVFKDVVRSRVFRLSEHKRNGFLRPSSKSFVTQVWVSTQIRLIFSKRWRNRSRARWRVRSELDERGSRETFLRFRYISNHILNRDRFNLRRAQTKLSLWFSPLGS